MLEFVDGVVSQEQNKVEEDVDKDGVYVEQLNGDGEDHDDYGNPTHFSSTPHVSENALYSELKALFTSHEEFCSQQFSEVRQEMAVLCSRLASLENDVSIMKKGGVGDSDIGEEKEGGIDDEMKCDLHGEDDKKKEATDIGEEKEGGIDDEMKCDLHGEDDQKKEATDIGEEKEGGIDDEMKCDLHGEDDQKKEATDIGEEKEGGIDDEMKCDLHGEDDQKKEATDIPEEKVGVIDDELKCDLHGEDDQKKDATDIGEEKERGIDGEDIDPNPLAIVSYTSVIMLILMLFICCDR
ncbi:hypothetical protein M5689_020632 [Euphorbia peplus]|nr:hypothetical protein M5689_020632 [Euphorbia peplus]